MNDFDIRHLYGTLQFKNSLPRWFYRWSSYPMGWVGRNIIFTIYKLPNLGSETVRGLLRFKKESKPSLKKIQKSPLHFFPTHHLYKESFFKKRKVKHYFPSLDGGWKYWGWNKSHVRDMFIHWLASNEFVCTKESFQSGRKINVCIWQEKKMTMADKGPGASRRFCCCPLWHDIWND